METMTGGNEVPLVPPDKETLRINSRNWWILAFVAIALAAFAYLFLKRDPHAPPAIVVSACPGLAPGTQRIKADFGTQFDISEKNFTTTTAIRDMPPSKFYVVTLRDSVSTMVIGHDDGVWGDAGKSSRAFSRHVDERNRAAAKGRPVGTDKWGYLNNGERWRYVAFSSGDAVGYRPASLREAILFDQLISSACRP